VSKEIHFAIISANSLVGIGLRTLLSDYFSASSVLLCKTFEAYQTDDMALRHDFLFLFPETYVAHNDDLTAHKRRLIILIEGDKNLIPANSGLATLNINLPEPELVNDIEKLVRSKNSNDDGESEELSCRELDVLRLVSLGHMNKTIADMLNISLHTVISHRKNITRKLGIKTVSGLTVYALINGLVTTEDLKEGQV
jgi:DNA-binding CsgD family transcriptional regulator